MAGRSLSCSDRLAAVTSCRTGVQPRPAPACLPATRTVDAGRTEMTAITVRTRDDGQVIRVVDDGDRRYDVVLSEEETRGGHTLRDHVGKTDEEMLERIRASKQEFLFLTYGIRRDGSFDSAESATDFVDRTLEQNASEVDLVASGKQANAFMKSRFGYKTGREAYTAGSLEPYMRNTYGVGVFMIRDPGSGKGYRLHTAYPRNDGD